MLSNLQRPAAAALLALACMTGSNAVSAADDAKLPDDPRAFDRWYVQTSLYTHHFNFDPEHNDHQRLIDIERQRADGWLAGAAFFRNSFDQATQLVYVGKMWRPFKAAPDVHVKLVGGLIHGYKGQYKDKIPLNHNGVAPAILPSIGWSGRRFASEVILFGTAGVMWTVGAYLD